MPPDQRRRYLNHVDILLQNARLLFGAEFDLRETTGSIIVAKQRSRKSLTPFIWVARGMKHGVYGDRCLGVLVKHCIGKTPYQAAAIALMNQRTHPRLPADAFNTCIEGTQELLA
jgi:hypothetical protein